MGGGLKITDRCFAFAVRAVKRCRPLESWERVSKTPANRLLCSVTSVRVNVKEARAGQNKADFIAKRSIARKEAHETRLLKEPTFSFKNSSMKLTKLSAFLSYHPNRPNKDLKC